MTGKLQYVIYLGLLIINISSPVLGFLKLTSSSATARDGELFTLICRKIGFTVSDQIYWYRSGVYQFPTSDDHVGNTEEPNLTDRQETNSLISEGTTPITCPETNSLTIEGTTSTTGPETNSPTIEGTTSTTGPETNSATFEGTTPITGPETNSPTIEGTTSTTGPETNSATFEGTTSTTGPETNSATFEGTTPMIGPETNSPTFEGITSTTGPETNLPTTEGTTSTTGPETYSVTIEGPTSTTGPESNPAIFEGTTSTTGSEIHSTTFEGTTVLPETNSIKLSSLLAGRINVSCDNYSHNVTLRINSTIDNGSVWQCTYDSNVQGASLTITVETVTANSATASPTTQTTTATMTKATKSEITAADHTYATGVIVAGVFAGVVVAIGVITAVVYYRSKNKKTYSEPSNSIIFRQNYPVMAVNLRHMRNSGRSEDHGDWVSGEAVMEDNDLYASSRDFKHVSENPDIDPEELYAKVNKPKKTQPSGTEPEPNTSPDLLTAWV